MPEFEKDFVLRQAKNLAKSLGGFLSQESIDEILQVDEQNGEQQKLDELTEDELRESK